jgi:hypothetical protein
MLAMIAMVGVVVDVGFGWAHQRDAQNGSDAAANAGAIVLLKKMTGGTSTNWDFDVYLAVQAAADQNGVTVPEAEYTDWQGVPIVPQAMVGGSDGYSVPASAQGVAVTGLKTFDTFFAQVIGISQMTAHTAATAVAGNIENPCDTTEGCSLLPIAFPATMVTCTNNGQDSVPAVDADGVPLPWPDNTRVIMPLCGGNPGSVGWIDWSPQTLTDGCTGTGTSEIICHVLYPPVTDIATPSWQYITRTGGIDSAALENALNTYAGQIVLLPLFDSTCDAEPSNPELDGCPPANVGGTGVNQWYHVPDPGFAAFRFDYPKGAYTNGNNSAVCDTGNGATDCVIGTFVNYVGSGTVGPPDPDSKFWGIQLIH